MNLNIIEDFIPRGRRNRPARANPMNFITIHETGNTRAGANARAHGSYLRSDAAANRPVSWHYTTDDRETVQHLPENEDAFHAGDGSGNGNRQSIGIEICVNSDGNFRKAIERTAVLVADICRRRNISIENIRQHFNWSRKNCPQNIRAGRPITWAVFLDLVRTALNAQTVTAPPVPSPPEPTQPTSTVNIALAQHLATVPAVKVGGRWLWDITLHDGSTAQVRLRDVLESLGYQVAWDEETGTITTVGNHK